MALRPARLRGVLRPRAQPAPHALHPAHLARLPAAPHAGRPADIQPAAAGRGERVRRELCVRGHHRREPVRVRAGGDKVSKGEAWGRAGDCAASDDAGGEGRRDRGGGVGDERDGERGGDVGEVRVRERRAAAGCTFAACPGAGATGRGRGGAGASGERGHAVDAARDREGAWHVYRAELARGQVVGAAQRAGVFGGGGL